MSRAAIVVVVVAALGTGIAMAVAKAPGRAPARERVLFREDFGGAELDETRWRTCHWWSERGCTIATNHELEWYVPQQVRVHDGAAHLVADRRRIVGADGRRYPFASGMLSTGPGPEGAPRFAFTYGRATIRARVPAGDGLWPAFWLLPADRRSEPEIDVMEVTSDEPDTVQMHLHFRRGDAERARGHDWQGLDPGWHTFAVDWRPGRLTWLVDGKRRWRVDGSMVPSEPMYLIANLAVSRDHPPTPRTPSPAEFAIDWVRVVR